MTLGQPQLLNIALDVADVVYTPDWVARDMVEFFKPSGRILEPCKGDGAFMRYLPGAEWCEIAEGRDFFAFTEHVDWCFGNPPYRMSGKWIRHSMEIANEFVYLLPCDKPFISYGMLTTMRRWGSLVHIRIYGTGSSLGFPIGYAVGALHFQRDYHGSIGLSYAK
jgi:hypothetical protein